MNATSKQTWCLFCILKIDVRNCGLDLDKASYYIGLAKTDPAKAAEELKSLGGVVKGEVKPKKDWQSLYNQARQAGLQAGQETVPTPMTVVQHANPLDDNSSVVKQWHVSDGVCGFAGCVVKDRSFMAWLRTNKIGYKHYYGGWYIPVHEFNQSLDRKEKAASAMAEVFKANGIEAYMNSRMD